MHLFCSVGFACASLQACLGLAIPTMTKRITAAHTLLATRCGKTTLVVTSNYIGNPTSLAMRQLVCCWLKTWGVFVWGASSMTCHAITYTLIVHTHVDVVCGAICMSVW